MPRKSSGSPASVDTDFDRAIAESREKDLIEKGRSVESLPVETNAKKWREDMESAISNKIKRGFPEGEWVHFLVKPRCTVRETQKDIASIVAREVLKPKNNQIMVGHGYGGCALGFLDGQFFRLVGKTPKQISTEEEGGRSSSTIFLDVTNPDKLKDFNRKGEL